MTSTSPTPRARQQRKYLRHHTYYEWSADLDSPDPEDRTPVEQRVKFTDGSWTTYRIDADNPDGWNEGRGWRYGWVPGGVEGKRLLYRAPQIREAIKRGETIVVFEGERDCDEGAARGLNTTTNAGGTGGSGKWKGERGLARRLVGANVVVVRDRDAPGLKHAREVVKSLMGVASSVQMMEPPAPHKDYADMVAAGLGFDDLVPIRFEWEDDNPTEHLHAWAMRVFPERGREVTCRDLTHQLRDGKFTEDESREAIRRYQAAVETTGSHPFTIDEALRTFDANFTAEPPTPREPWITSEIETEVQRLRVRRQATRLLDEEEATAQLILPPATGNLAAELALAKPTPTYTVAELHPAGANVIFVAAFKVGKTTLLNNLSASLVDGEPFLGRFDVGPLAGNVAVWNLEVSAWQYEAWARPLGIKNADRIWPLHLRGAHVPLTTKAGQDFAVRWLEEHNVAVWILDPFARAYSGEENSNSEVGRFLDALDIVKNRAGVRDLVMAVHSGRAEMAEGAERARGATRLDDWADARWLYSRTGRIDGPRFFAAEGRDVSVGEFEVMFDPVTLKLTAQRGTRKDHRDRQSTLKLLSIVSASPGISKSDAKNALGGSGGVQSGWISDAVLLRYVEVRENGKRHELFVTELGEGFLRTGRESEKGVTG